MKTLYTAIVFIGILLTAVPAHAQDPASAAMERGEYEIAIPLFREILQADPDSYSALFGLARALAFAGYREEAIQVLSTLLDYYPDDADGLLMRGRIYAWNRNYVQSERDLRQVTSGHPDYADAWSALGDMYFWSDRDEDALDAYRQWQSLRPEAPEPHLTMARIHRSMRNFTQARRQLRYASEKGGDHTEIDRLMRSLNRIPAATRWETYLSFKLNTFTPHKPEWNTWSTGLKREFSFGSLNLGLNRYRRWDRWAESISLDSYFDLWRKAYGNVRVELEMENEFLPEQDFIAEIFQGLGRGWELSGGAHWMIFGDNTVDMYLMSLGKYLGPWYFRDRVIFVPKDNGYSQTHIFMARYYPGTVDNYYELTYGVSQSVEENEYSLEMETNVKQSYGAALQRFFTPRIGMFLSGGYKVEADDSIERSLSCKLVYRF